MRKRNKIKVGLVLVIWGILFVTSLAGQAQDDIYEKYCTKGKQGYYRFRYEVIGIKKKEFWQTFIAMVQNFYSKKEIGKLLNCSLFWNEFKQDDFFDIHNQRLSEGKEKIDKIVEFVVSGKIYEYKQNRIFKKFYKNKQGYWEGVLKDSGIILVLIPAGTFIMGSDNGDNDERPAHSVYLDEYWIGKYEITTYNYHQFLRKKRKDEPIDTYLQLPARWISWNEAVEFCMWLSEKTGLMVYLPTEAQWEKAARGTNGNIYPWGNNLPNTRAIRTRRNPINLIPVGSKINEASPYGCMDMAGNVWEWCQDWYNRDYYSEIDSENPQGTPSGKYKVIRGGLSFNAVGRSRTTDRNHYNGSDRSNFIGFRIAAEIKR